MTIYVKELLGKLDKKYGHLKNGEFAGKLFEIGVIDHTLCKILSVREFVAEKVASGTRKTEAMWLAADHFCCSYEYVRKCIYYYTDVNMD